MTRTTLATALATAITATAGIAYQGPSPNTPDPTDRGGEFAVSGCVEQEAGRAGVPPVYRITRVSTATGEGRAASAMGAGVPTPGTHSSAVKPSDPPELVASEYRIVAVESADLPKYVNQTVEARGTLQDLPPSAGGMASRNAPEAADSTTTPAVSAAAGKVFVATSIKKLADTCTSVRGS
jgi:hypothetical protein